MIVFSFLIGIFAPSFLYAKPLEVAIFIPRVDLFWKKTALFTKEAAIDLGMRLRVYNANDNPDKMIAEVRKTAQSGYAADIILSDEDHDWISEHAVLMVANEVDAFIDSLDVFSTTIEKNFIPDIKVIKDTSLKEVENPALHIGVSRENPILRNILNKGLDTITREEINAIREKWIPVEMGVTEALEYKWNKVWRLIGVVFLILLNQFLFGVSRDKHVALRFGSRRFRMYAVIGLSLLITVVSVLGWLAVQRNK